MTTYEECRRLRLNDLRLEELDVSLDAVSNILELAEALHNNTTVKSVRAHVHDSFAGRTPSEVLLFFEALGSRPQLKQLFFGPYRYPQQARLNCQALSLSLIQASQLTALELCGIELSGSLSDFHTLGASLQSHPSLQEFRLHDCQIEEELHQNNSNALDPLLKSLSTIQTIERVTLNSKIKGSLGNIGDSALENLCSCPNLKAIGLQGFEIVGKHFSSAIRGLSSTVSIQEICIGTCKLGSTGDLALSQILRSNASLEYFDLQLEEGESPIQVSLALADNTALKHFFIHGKISLDSQKAFATAIQSNHILETLELMDGSTQTCTIKFFLRMNELRRGLLLEQKQCSKEEWMDVLVSQSEDLSAIFYLISINPMICCVG